ncbi:Na+/H+ antiporter subunit E [Nocardioides pacificus]
MSPVTRTRRDGSVRPARYRAVQPSVIVWLTVVWLILWGAVTPLLVVGGVLVAVVVCVVFPLPPIRMEMRPRPLALVALLVRFLKDVVVASVEVARVALRRDCTLRNAVIAVTLRTPSDFVLTVVAEMVSLVPGSIVVEARRSTHTLFLHVLDVRDLEGVERFRASVLDLEARVVHAFGAATEPTDTAREGSR